MTFQQLSYLVEVAKTGSINKTSRQLFVSQSCISSSLQQLENELNVKLLTRNSRGVELTAEGKELVQYAASILEQKNILQSLCASSPSTISTSFSVSSQRYPFVESAFLKLLQESEASFYKYTINECPMDTIIDEVRDSRSNLGVIFINSTTRRVLESILKKNELQFETLAEITPGIYLSKKHPLLRESSITMEDLCRYPFLSYKQNDGVAMDFSEEAQEEQKEDGIQDDEICIVGGLLTNINKRITKKNEMMAFLTIEDNTASMEVVAFPRTFEAAKEFLTGDSKIFVKGRIQKKDEGEAKLIAEKIILFAKVPKEIWVQFSDKEEYEKREAELLQILKEYKGESEVVLYLRKEKAIKRLPGEFRIDSGEGTRSLLMEKFGTENVKEKTKSLKFL